MAQHCPYCDSTNIEHKSIVKNGQTVWYWQCNDCNRKFGAPVVDPEFVADDTTTSGAGSEKPQQ